MIKHSSHNPIKVLIVDDSALIRQTLSSILQSDPDIEVIAMASDPYEAVKEIRKQAPDVITLDIEMPGMDGLTFLKKIMNQHPIPVVMISSLTTQGSSSAIKALQYGAVEVISKPKVNTKSQLIESQTRLCDAVKAASMASMQPLRMHRKVKDLKPEGVTVSDIDINLPCLHSDSIIYIGASTGGTQIITHLLQNLNKPAPPILITQHMPAEFTKLFAQRLNKLSKLNIKEAEQGELIRHSCVYIAPGNQHLTLKRSDIHFVVDLIQEGYVNRHRPSVDVLFDSAVGNSRSNSIAILLTGMGEDGAKSLLKLREIGAQTIAQDEESSAVFGMPKRAIEIGAAKHIYKPDEMIEFIQKIQSNTYKS